MVMQIISTNDIKVYNVTAAKSIPQWVAKRNQKQLKYDPEFRNRIELIQDLEFPCASSQIKLSPDGQYLISTGVYKPQVRVFDLNQLGLKFERHLDCEVIQFQTLSDDWTKLVFLQMDRSIEFHTAGGTYFKTRVPKFGRDMVYHTDSSDLIVVGASNEIWRLNLDQGRFLAPFTTQHNGINVCKVSPAHQLVGVGTESGKIEFWDPRVRTPVGCLDVGSQIVQSYYSNDTLSSSMEISAMRFFENGLEFAIGTSTGQVALYDLRRSSPILTKDHQYGCPIKDIKYHSSGNVITADSKILKIWNRESGKVVTSIEPTADINNVCVVPDSGLMFFASETPKIQIYYVPSLGPAPKFASFLDHLTEELEEQTEPIIYDDYKFVTRPELENLGLGHLIGTNLLRAYMHGFFIDIRLYQKAKAIANPFEYEEYRKQEIQKRIDKDRASRISKPTALPKVNKNLAKRLLAQKPSSNISEETDGSNLLGDERFASMFTDPTFEIDEEDENYIALHPTKAKVSLKDQFEKIYEDPFEGEMEGKGSDESSSDDDSDDDLVTQVARNYRTKGKDVDNDADTNSAANTKMDFYEIKQGHNIKGLSVTQKTNDVSKQKTFASRLQNEEAAPMLNTGKRTGNLEMSFSNASLKPTLKKARDNNREAEGEPKRHRRGIQDLPLKRLGGRGGYRERGRR